MHTDEQTPPRITDSTRILVHLAHVIFIVARSTRQPAQFTARQRHRRWLVRVRVVYIVTQPFPEFIHGHHISHTTSPHFKRYNMSPLPLNFHSDNVSRLFKPSRPPPHSVTTAATSAFSFSVLIRSRQHYNNTSLVGSNQSFASHRLLPRRALLIESAIFHTPAERFFPSTA